MIELAVLIGNAVIKVACFICVLMASQYFNNPGILWFWLLTLIIGINYRKENKDESEEKE